MSWRKDRQHYWELRAQGRCVTCGVHLCHGETTVRCSACNERRNTSRNEQRRRWLYAGLCRTCGALVDQGHTRCQQCLRDKHYKRTEQPKRGIYALKGGYNG